MHIPDGFLNAATVATTWAVSTGAAANAVRVANKNIGEKHIPMMGILAAFVFAAGMLNFPVAGGTSGHLLGGALAAILLGPWAAIVIMTAVVGVQALVFQDGGLTALGANVLNMGVVTALLGYAVYAPASHFANGRLWLRQAGAFAAAWLTVQASAGLTAFELAVSDTSPLSVVLPSMMGVHALIGIGEGLITVAALSLVATTRRDLLPTEVALSEE